MSRKGRELNKANILELMDRLYLGMFVNIDCYKDLFQ